MKKLLTLVILLISISAYAQLTQEEADKFVKSLDWSKAKVDEQKNGDLFMKTETLPNAVKLMFSKDLYEQMVKMIKEQSDPINVPYDPRLSCYPMGDTSSNMYVLTLIKDDYRTFLSGGESMFSWKSFPVYMQIQESSFICKPEITQYNKQSLAKAYSDNSYALSSKHYQYKDSFKFTGTVKNIENRNNYPVVVFDIEKPKYSGINVINMTQFVCMGIASNDVVKIKAGQEISVIAWDLRTWDNPHMNNWLRFSTPGEVVANCEMFE